MGSASGIDPNENLEEALMAEKKMFETPDEFKAWMANFEKRDGYKRPQAFGVGSAVVGNADTPFLDTYFQVPNFEGNYGTAAVLASIVGYRGGNEHFLISRNEAQRALDMLSVFANDGNRHPNIEALKVVAEGDAICQRLVVFLEDVQTIPPIDVPDAYLRLHLLSHRLVKPNSINVDKVFAVMPNIAWTSEGPMAIENAQAKLASRAPGFFLRSLDKFPSMLDYVVPDKSVRIADGARVRLGAYLGNGTTVMHEGFCNYNAGCDGPNMIEGRISQGVWVGKNSDIGGGASLMGTLSGGGKERVSVGEDCLIGANAGIGISLGNNCAVEAGLYITAGKRVWYNGERVKALTLSGRDHLRFINNDGKIVVTDEGNKVGLNPALHAA